MPTIHASDQVNRRQALQQLAAGAVGAAGACSAALGQGEQPAAAGKGGKTGGVFVERQGNGAEIWQVTTEERPHSNIYCEVPYCSEDSRHLVYERRGEDRDNRTDFVAVELGTWQERVLDSSLGMAGCAITPDGMFYYLERSGETQQLRRAKLPDGKPEPVHQFAEAPWTWSFGTVSPDHRYYVRGKRLDDKWKLFGILLVDLQTGEETLIDQDPYTFNAHPQFDLGGGRQVMVQHNRGGGFDSQGQNYRSTGPEGATLYVVSVPDGKRTELQVGKPYTSPVTGHEAWIGQTGEMLLSVSASGDYAPEQGNLLGVRPGAAARVVAKGYKFNHVGVSRCGRLFSADDYQGTFKVVIGSTQTGKSAVVCESLTQPTNAQNTHAHPYLTPDLKWVVFNSNRSGFPHVYAARVPEGRVDELLRS